MTDLQRIQRKRTKGWRMPANTVYVGRGSPWGNPFSATQDYIAFSHIGFPIPLINLLDPPGLDRCIDLYTAYIYGIMTAFPGYLDQLRGKNLACWCPLDQLCHADVLLRLANELPVRKENTVPPGTTLQ